MHLPVGAQAPLTAGDGFDPGILDAGFEDAAGATDPALDDDPG